MKVSIRTAIRVGMCSVAYDRFVLSEYKINPAGYQFRLSKPYKVAFIRPVIE